VETRTLNAGLAIGSSVNQRVVSGAIWP
jgi:hypothetical protein